MMEYEYVQFWLWMGKERSEFEEDYMKLMRKR